MGLFGRIKNILFDEEDDDIVVPLEEEKTVEISLPPKAKIKIEEPVFKEPIFDDVEKPTISIEDEFELPKPSSNYDRKEFKFPLDIEENDYTEPIKTNLEDTTKIPGRDENRDYDRYNINTLDKKETKKPFKPSPMISPIYGIMDKNYKKEDIVVKERTEVVITPEQQKNITIDSVRKKAYGDKSEIEIEETIIEEDLVLDPLKSIEELYQESEDIKPIKPLEDIIEQETMEKNISSDLNETFKIDDVIKELKKTSSDLSKEEDIFDLIDSIYEERKES